MDSKTEEHALKFEFLSIHFIKYLKTLPNSNLKVLKWFQYTIQQKRYADAEKACEVLWDEYSRNDKTRDFISLGYCLAGFNIILKCLQANIYDYETTFMYVAKILTELDPRLETSILASNIELPYADIKALIDSCK